MNKLCALILLFLAQSVCAMEGEQSKPRVFSFFNGGKPFEDDTSDESIDKMINLRKLTDEQASLLKKCPVENRKDKCFEFCLETWKKKEFTPIGLSILWQSYVKKEGWSDEAISACLARAEEIELAAKRYDIGIRCAKIAIANVASYATVDPLLKAFGHRFLALNDKGIVTIRDISVPITSLLVASIIRFSEFCLGHAVFNSSMKRPYDGDQGGLPQRSTESAISSIDYLPAAVGRSLKDEFKIAAIVSILRIMNYQAMHASGAHDTLQAIKAHMTKNNNKLSSVISDVSTFLSYAGRPLAHALVEHMFYDRQQYKRYTYQPNCPA